MRTSPHPWKRFLQRALVASLAAVPVTVWAPNELVKSDILELALDFKVVAPHPAHSKLALSEAQAKHVTDFLNSVLLDRGVRFTSHYSLIDDSKLSDLSEVESKNAALKIAERHATKGRVTIVVPGKVDFSAAYLGQPLEAGPIAIFGGKGGLLAAAQVMGQVFGFSHICGDARNIMYRPCANYSTKTIDTLDWTYFTSAPEAQAFSQVLNLWKWDASGYLQSKLQEGRQLANAKQISTIPTTP